MSGHNSGVRNALFFKDSQSIVSVADDQTLRFWDCRSLSEIKRFDFQMSTNSCEMTRDGRVLTVCSGSKVSFWNTEKMEKIKEYDISTNVLSASLHPEKEIFVCGGEDFKVYKCDYLSGMEIGKLFIF